jgi:hypothetical protein
MILRAAPRDDAPGVTLVSTVGGRQFDFQRLTERAAWMRVVHEARGVQTTGWIRRADVQSTDGPSGESGGCSGNHGGGLFGRSWGGRPPIVVYKGSARLRIGAKLFYYDDRPWATVLRPDRFEVQVLEWPGRRVVEVLDIPGIGIRPGEATMKVKDLIDPDPTSLAGTGRE